MPWALANFRPEVCQVQVAAAEVWGWKKGEKVGARDEKPREESSWERARLADYWHTCAFEQHLPALSNER